MNLWRAAEGIVEAELTGAEPSMTLYAISQSAISLSQIKWTGELTVQFCCCRRDWAAIMEICRKKGDDLYLIRETGLPALFKKMMYRPILVMGFAILLLLTAFLPTRVLFFRVEGNEAIAAQQILTAAEECGICFGASRRAVRSEKMKNALLSAIPELKWAGINTVGCTAIISVKERESQEKTTKITGLSSIVAARDGYITSCTVTRGNGLCTPGQVVQKGQVLISGYTDCGICIKVTQAQGEIFAQTIWPFRAITPSTCLIRKEETNSHQRYSLNLGKKRINFWKGSGISDATCGRMYKEYYITLPGGFYLPISIGVETLTDWECAAADIPAEGLDENMKSFSRSSILGQMVAGSILQEYLILSNENDRYILDGRFLCTEMIGRVITEEIGESNGKTD